MKTLLAVAMLAAGCAWTKPLAHDLTVCPEYRDLRCLTAPDCSMDEKRGCRVCQCGPGPGEKGDTGRLETHVPPDQRGPQ